MSITTLARAKSHSNIYFDDKDEELQIKLDAAEEFLAEFMNRPLSDLYIGGDSPDSPARLKASVEVLVFEVFDDYWQNKGAFYIGSPATQNPAWLNAAHFYRIGLGV